MKRPLLPGRQNPVLDWLFKYQKANLSGDFTAGVIVAIVLIPQSMAYAMVAGLPPQVGLYASVLPIVLYSIFGSSQTLAVGPVGLMSIMTGSLLYQMDITDQQELLAVAVLLALLSGITLLAMRLIRLGSIVNFISHPVISGFTSAAAILIIFSQFKHLLGFDVPGSLNLLEKLQFTIAHFDKTNYTTLSIGLFSIILLITLRGSVAKKIPFRNGDLIGKASPLLIVIGGITLTSLLDLAEAKNVSIVGTIPAGLPDLKLPPLDSPLLMEILPAAALIGVVGFLESISVAKALASRRREKIDANKELLALGAANVGASLTGGHPVAGGLGRSMINFSSGANTPLAGIITAGLVALSLVCLTPYFYHLPRAVLSAIIIVAVSGLIDLKTIKKAWNYDRSDAATLIITFLAVFILGIEQGILLGALLSVALYLHRSSEPHVAVVGRISGSEHFRNIERHDVETHRHLLALRIDENLYFANINYLEDKIMSMIVDNPKIKHLVLICSAVNYIDSSALEALEALIERFNNAGVTVHLAEVKGPVMDKLNNSGFPKHLGGQIFFTTHDAFKKLDNA